MPAGDAFKVSIQATGQNSIYMNVLAIRQIGAVDLTAADIQVFADGWKDVFRPSQNQTLTWRSWRAVQVFGPTVDYTVKQCERVGGAAFEGNLTGTLTGGEGPADALPPQSAFVITFGSGLIGRRHRGRVYSFGYGEIQQSAGTWIPSMLTTITTALNTWFNKYKSSGTDPKIQLGIWSERTAFGCVWVGKPPVHQVDEGPHPDLAFTPVTGYTMRNTVYTQRRRALGVGR